MPTSTTLLSEIVSNITPIKDSNKQAQTRSSPFVLLSTGPSMKTN